MSVDGGRGTPALEETFVPTLDSALTLEKVGRGTNTNGEVSAVVGVVPAGTGTVNLNVVYPLNTAVEESGRVTATLAPVLTQLTRGGASITDGTVGGGSMLKIGSLVTPPP